MKWCFGVTAVIDELPEQASVQKHSGKQQTALRQSLDSAFESDVVRVARETSQSGASIADDDWGISPASARGSFSRLAISVCVLFAGH